MRKNKGFTLVELLVVIGIIALLISILLPALNKARENAKLVTCSSLMRQIALAARTYATENKDYLPPFANDRGPFYHIYDKTTEPAYTVANNNNGSTIAYARTVFWVWDKNGNPTAAELADPKSTMGAGIGRLINRGYLRGEFYKMMTCPSVYAGEGAGQLGDAVNGNATYGFNPHLALRNSPDGSGTLLQQPWWRKLASYGRVKQSLSAMRLSGAFDTTRYEFGGRRFALVTDPINYPGTISPSIGAPTHLYKNNYAVNLCFSDGSVQPTYLSKNVNRAGGNYTRFYDLLSYLEMTLEGGGTGSTYTPGKFAFQPINP